jgi:hypothetical protein
VESRQAGVWGGKNPGSTPAPCRKLSGLPLNGGLGNSAR